MEYLQILAGLMVGLLVGLSGVGGGSLMTPILIYGFNIPFVVAVGTDLLFATATKLAGVARMHQDALVDWHLVTRFSLGSLPAALIATLVASSLGGVQAGSDVLQLILAFALLCSGLSALGLFNKIQPKTNYGEKFPTLVTVAGGLIGILVALTSIGGGALGVLALRLLFPSYPAQKIIATDIAFAVPLTLTASIGHLFLGNVDFKLLLYVLAGSIPGVLLGSRIGMALSAKVLRRILGFVLIVIALKVFLAVAA